jgi:hypothetical protein
MELAGEMHADIVTVLHISPAANKEFRERVTSPFLRRYYNRTCVMDIWQKLIEAKKFMSISVEDLLDTITETTFENSDWVRHLNTRYGWNRKS